MFKQIKEQLVIPWFEYVQDMRKPGREFVEFDADAFEGYRKYDEANPNRFDVKYDENLNRIWE